MSMSIVWILTVIFVFAFFMRWMDVMAKDRQARMKLLEEAVKAGNLDEDVRHELVAAVTGRRPPRHKVPAASPPPYRATILERLLLFVGWMGFLVGVALLIYGVSASRYGSGGYVLIGIFTGLAGFALVTYPFVIRELESRGNARVTR